jgi:hypothetical protein
MVPEVRKLAWVAFFVSSLGLWLAVGLLGFLSVSMSLQTQETGLQTHYILSARVRKNILYLALNMSNI